MSTDSTVSISTVSGGTEINLQAAPPLTLTNVGAGEEILVAPDEFKTLVSTDSTVSISTVSGGTEINLQAAPPLTLTNVGSGEQILIAPDQFKTLVSTDSSVSISTTGNEINLQAASTTPSPYQESGGFITPVNPSVNATVAGSSNVITGTSTDSFSGGGNLNNITSVTNSSVTGGNNNTITSVNNSSMDSCQGCNLIGSRTNRSSIQSCNNCSIQTSSSAGNGQQCVILGSTNCDFGAPGNGRVAGDHMAIIGCQNVEMGYWNTGTTCTVAAFNGLPFSTGGGGSNAARCFIAAGSNGVNSGNFVGSTIFGSNWSSGNTGHFMFTDIAGGSTHTTFANNSFSVRCAGGARFYTNTANTAGVQLNAGSSAWAPVCDVNKKENLVNLGGVDCSEICKKIVDMPLYKYNYIGNPKEQVCYSPTAQDWHSTFGCENIDVPRTDYTVDEDGNTIEVPVLDEDGEQIIDTKPAKDPLTIETMDMLGLLMATVKDLNSRLNAVKQPELYFINEPLNTNYPPVRLGDIGTKVFEYTCPKTGKLSLVASGCFQKISGNAGTIFIQLRLNGRLFSPSVQSGYEGETSTYAPDVSGLTINWCGEVNEGDVLTVYGLATSGAFSLRQSGLYGGAAGAQLSITQY